MAWNDYDKMLVFASMLSGLLRQHEDCRETEALHRENVRMRQEYEESKRRREREQEQRAALRAVGLDIWDRETPQGYFERLCEASREIMKEKERLTPSICYSWALERYRELDAQWSELDRKKELYLQTLYPPSGV